MGWYEILTSATAGAIILISVLGIVFSFIAPATDKWNRRYLNVLFSLQLACIVFSSVDALIYNNPDLASLDKVINFAVVLFMIILMSMPTLFLLRSSGESIKDNVVFKVVAALGISSLIMLIVAQFSDVFYSITPEEMFSRGPLFPLLLAPIVAIVLINIVFALVRRKKMPRSYFIASMVYLPPIAIALGVHMFIFFEYFVFLAVGLWAITVLVLAIRENAEQHIRQQREIAAQRASIMVLEMRPHFIYNTLTSIYYLCDQDPQKAKQVTLDFTTYLRKNLAAIAREGLIPFAEELEHTKAYLAVEQAQFEDGLVVFFDTPHTSFRLPPLTLQPIVENAVKHGLTQSNELIHISVFTRKVDGASEILVQDDGPGFQPTEDTPHIALNNIRERLQMMCGGSLTISSTEGGGTTVKIHIPER